MVHFKKNLIRYLYTILSVDYSRKGNRSSTRLIDAEPTDLTDQELEKFKEIKWILSTPPFKRSSNQLKTLKDFLLQTDYFKRLLDKENEDAIKECSKYMQYYYSSLKTFTLEKKGLNSRYYLILSGLVRLFNTNSNETLELCKGQSFGTSLLNYNSDFDQVTCLSPSHFAVLDSVDFKKINDHLLEKKFRIVLKFLSTIPVLNGLSKMYIKKILDCFSVKCFKRREKVFREKDLCDFVYFIDDGEFLLSKRDRISTISPLRNYGKAVTQELMTTHKVAILSNGEIVGDEDLILNNKLRSFTCECYSENGRLLMISCKEFMENLGNGSDVIGILKKRVEARESNRKVLTQKNSELMKLRLPSPKPQLSPLVSPRSNIRNIITRLGHQTPSRTPRSSTPKN